MSFDTMDEELRRLLALSSAGKLEGLAIVSISDGAYEHQYGAVSDDLIPYLLAGVCMLRHRIEGGMYEAQEWRDDESRPFVLAMKLEGEGEGAVQCGCGHPRHHHKRDGCGYCNCKAFCGPLSRCRCGHLKPAHIGANGICVHGVCKCECFAAKEGP